MKPFHSLSLFLFLFLPVIHFAQTPKATKYFEWSNKNYIIQNPVFAHSDSELVFVRQFYIPDGHAAEEREKYVEKLLAKAEKEKRYADPVVTVLNLKTKKLTQIDYGWEPAFSPNDKQIVYSYQAVPISGKRVLAETLTGNKIKLYNRKTKKYEIVASPATTFLLEPLFLDSATILYKTGDAVNGAYGGGIAFNAVNLLTKQTEALYTATKSHGLYHLAGELYSKNQGPCFTVYIPQDSNSWMADKYDHLLLTPAGLIHDFGIGSFNNMADKLAIDEEENLTYLDDNHDLLADTNFVIKYHDNQVIYKKPLSFEYDKAFLSPDGKFILYFTYEHEVFLMETNSFARTKLELPATEIYTVKWSDDSNRLAIVQWHPKLQDTDLISLFQVK